MEDMSRPFEMVKKFFTGIIKPLSKIHACTMEWNEKSITTEEKQEKLQICGYCNALNQWVKEEITRGFGKYLEANENQNITNLMGYNESSAKREGYSGKCLHLKKVLKSIN